MQIRILCITNNYVKRDKAIKQISNKQKSLVRN